MLPVIPFEVLLPLALAASLACLSLVVIILVRRLSVRWWREEVQERMVERMETVLIGSGLGDTSATSVVEWLSPPRRSRIGALVESVSRVRADGDGDLTEWLMATGVSDRLVEILERRPTRFEATVRQYRWVRVDAARAIGELGLRDSVASLARALDDHDDEVAYAAADALSRLGGPGCAESILTKIGEGSRLNDKRLAACVEAMETDLSPTFRSLLVDPDPTRAFWLISLAGQRRMYELVEDLRPHLASEDPDVRSAACEAIGELGVPLTDRWLAPLLDDDAWFVRSKAARALGSLNAEWAVEEIAELLASRHWWVRQNAIQALVEIGAPSADAVEEVLRSDDRFARNSAVEVLERIGWLDETIERAAGGGRRASHLLSAFASNGGMGYVENALWTCSRASVPYLLELLRSIGDHATFGRLRAAAENFPDDLARMAREVAVEVQGR